MSLLVIDINVSKGVFRNYTLDHEDVCHRTQVAVRVATLPLKQWQKYVSHGEEGNEMYTAKIDAMLLKVINKYGQLAYDALKRLKSVGNCDEKDTLRKRWKQILDLLQNAQARARKE
jgi:hypothetical protein